MEHATLIRRWTKEAVEGGRVDVFDELLDPNVCDRSGPEPTTGRESFKKRAEAVRAAFSDIVVTVDDVIASNDALAWRWTLEGTKGGARVKVRGVNFQRVRDGRVVEHWTMAV